MKRKTYAKTIALVLATTTTLQVTGIASKLVNGEAFVKVNAAEGLSETTAIQSEGEEGLITTPPAVTVTPAAVTIKGTEKAGNTLTAQFIAEDLTEISVTTSSSISYKWYRLSSKSSNPKLVGQDKEYNLVTSDAGKRIKLVTSYNGKIFEDITSIIGKRSSHSNSNSNSNSSSNDTETSDNTDITNDTSKKDSNKASARWEKNPNGSWEFIENGQLVRGWKQVKGTWYLMDSTGIMQKGWKQVGDTWYFLKNDGAMKTGWQQSNGKWYLLKDNGSMATGWQKVNGRWYFLYSDGSMASNTTINGYKVDASGAWI